MSADLQALIERLASAVTDEEARLALGDAMDRVWPGMPHPSSPHRDAWSTAFDILSGPPAGWLGVAVLMIPDDHWWQLDKLKDHGASAWVGPREPRALTTGADAAANRADCALVIAALQARAA